MAARTDSISFTLDTGTGSKDFVFTVTQLPPTRAYKFIARVGRVLGPALPDLLNTAGSIKGLGSLASANVDLAKLGAGLQKLFINLQDGEMDSILETILSTATVSSNGKTGDLTKNVFDTTFAGSLGDSFKFLAFAFKVNFSGFFPGNSGSPAA